MKMTKIHLLCVKPALFFSVGSCLQLPLGVEQGGQAENHLNEFMRITWPVQVATAHSFVLFWQCHLAPHLVGFRLGLLVHQQVLCVLARVVECACVCDTASVAG